MKLPNLKKYIVISILILTLSISSVFAYESRDKYLVDEKLADQTNIKYAQPTNIWITHVKLSPEIFNSDIKSLYNEIYYYSITRLGYADMPFTYVVDEGGNVVEGRYGGVGVVSEIEGDKGGVLIGYVSKTNDITPLALTSIKQLISEVSYNYGVTKKGISVVTLESVKREGATTKSRIKSVNNSFSSSIYTSISKLQLYEKPNQKLKAEIVSLNYEKTAPIGGKIQVELIVKNVDKFPWFTNRDYIYVSTLKDRDSKFVINGEWDSFSKPTSISNKTVLPGEQVTLVFQISAMQIPGRYSEKFVLKRLPNNEVAGTNFNIEFNIDKGNTKLVKINAGEGGYLNVRECPGPGCKSFGKVNDDQVLIMIEKANGWYKIKYSDTKDGWIYGPYVIEL